MPELKEYQTDKSEAAKEMHTDIEEIKATLGTHGVDITNNELAIVELYEMIRGMLNG